MYDDPCPNCGHRRKPMLMSTNPDAPGFRALLRGEGDPFMQFIARYGSLFLLFLIVVGILVMLH